MSAPQREVKGNIKKTQTNRKGKTQEVGVKQSVLLLLLTTFLYNRTLF